MCAEVEARLADSKKAEFAPLGRTDPEARSQADRRELHFEYAYGEVSCRTGEGVEDALQPVIEKTFKERMARRTEAKRERDFGLTVIQPEADEGERQRARECCQRVQH